ncbi:hypothetical protein JR316_0009281 [Psilocybe cubensis]|uniref:Uncharacterized protein n=2 Tax=Psilocybe cubensis TaxID=181762 RepID=A0ACB8GUW6_PSICU|nr:hypothetical protein JR316_0009281 [Psilocybe cubensis]KAH9478819.1 hypothetical protein JR316_0009281 [Psilocybe cubensis]
MARNKAGYKEALIAFSNIPENRWESILNQPQPVYLRQHKGPSKYSKTSKLSTQRWKERNSAPFHQSNPLDHTSEGFDIMDWSRKVLKNPDPTQLLETEYSLEQTRPMESRVNVGRGEASDAEILEANSSPLEDGVNYLNESAF